MSKKGYSILGQRDHCRHRPDTYTGSAKSMPREEYIWESGKIHLREITLPQTVERIFLEVLSNATDNIIRSREQGVPYPSIEVSLRDKVVTVRNGGTTIPLQTWGEHIRERGLTPSDLDKKNKNLLVPEVIFGEFMSSSNYDSKGNKGCGRNGLGVKLTNVWSKSFTVTIFNKKLGEKYKQTWTGGMKDKEPPVVEKFDSDESFTEISYVLDMAAFPLIPNYKEELNATIMKACVDASFTTKEILYYNGLPVDYRDISEYCSLYLPGDSLPKHIHLSSDEYDLFLLDTPREAKIISFVNGIITRAGGVHTEAAIKSVRGVVEYLNKDTTKDKLTIADIRPHISIVISARLHDPEFEGQMKNKLTSPAIKIVLPESELAKMKKWKLYEELKSSIERKNLKELKKTDGKKIKYIGSKVPDAEDANLAGTSKSNDCVLWIVEGKSAMQYAVSMISGLPGKRDLNGVFPIQGKPINAMRANLDSILKNVVIAKIKALLGLVDGKDYSSDQARKTLRYSKCMFLADADEDGTHIESLLLNLFYTRWPSLFKSGYLGFVKTPIVRANKGSLTKKFYSHRELEDFMQHNNMKGWAISYFKGLGSSTTEEAKEDNDDRRLYRLEYDPLTDEAMKLTFSREHTDGRKEWIARFKFTKEIDDNSGKVAASEFLYRSMQEFFLLSLRRAIPKMTDGQKDSQTRILYACMQKWGKPSEKKCGSDSNDKCLSGTLKMKTAQLASYTADLTHYPHGEQCLCETVIGMAQTFPGSNNLALLSEDGGFGTRNLGGKDASKPRYTTTRPKWSFPYLFPGEDRQFHEMIIQDGQKTSPETLFPLVPLSVINGAVGVACGYSTYIPSHNPVDVVDYYLGKRENIEPWYRGFKGKVTVFEKKRITFSSKKKPLVKSDELLEKIGEAYDIESTPEAFETFVFNRSEVKSSGAHLTTEGVFEYLDDDTIRITEIPLNTTTHKYGIWLEYLRSIGAILEHSNNSEENSIDFTVQINKEHFSEEHLRLSCKMSMQNMVLLDTSGTPKLYKNSKEILDEFREWRLGIYRERKNKKLEGHRDTLRKLSQKMEFVRLVLKGEIKIIGVAREQRKRALIGRGFDVSLLTLSIGSMSPEDIEEMQEELEKIEEKIEKLEKKPAEEMWREELEEFKAELVKRRYK